MRISFISCFFLLSIVALSCQPDHGNGQAPGPLVEPSDKLVPGGSERRYQLKDTQKILRPWAGHLDFVLLDSLLSPIYFLGLQANDSPNPFEVSKKLKELKVYSSQSWWDENSIVEQGDTFSLDHTLRFDHRGNVLSWTKGTRLMEDFRYDASDRPVLRRSYWEDHGNGPKVRTTWLDYDGLGRLIHIFVFDSLPGGEAEAFSYQTFKYWSDEKGKAGNIVALESETFAFRGGMNYYQHEFSPDHRLENTFQLALLPTGGERIEITDSYDYQSIGGQTKLKLKQTKYAEKPTSFMESFQYDSLGRITTKEVELAGKNGYVEKWNYQHSTDTVRLIHQKDRTGDGVDPWHTEDRGKLCHNERGHLTYWERWDMPKTDVIAEKYDYTYDQHGNWVKIAIEDLSPHMQEEFGDEPPYVILRKLKYAPEQSTGSGVTIPYVRNEAGLKEMERFLREKKFYERAL